MAMVGTVMGDAMFDAVAALSIPQDREQTESERRAVYHALAGAIISHIQNNGVVNVSGSAAVTTAPGTAPVTASGSVS